MDHPAAANSARSLSAPPKSSRLFAQRRLASSSMAAGNAAYLRFREIQAQGEEGPVE